MKSPFIFLEILLVLLLIYTTVAVETSRDENKLDEEGKETNQYGGGRCYYGCCGGWGRYGCRWCCGPAADIAGEAHQVPNGYGSGGGYGRWGGYGGGGWGGHGGGGGYGGWGGYGGGGWGGRGGGGGYGGGGWGGHGGGYGGGGGNCHYGCCGGGGYGKWGGCKCCFSAQEAKAYNENQAKP